MTTPAGAHNDDEMDLINAEFDSMVAGLSLDESSPRTYLDELEEIEKEEVESLNYERALYAQVESEKVPLQSDICVAANVAKSCLSQTGQHSLGWQLAEGRAMSHRVQAAATRRGPSQASRVGPAR